MPQLRYDPNRDAEPMPAPLNGPSMALGTWEDVERMLPRLDPLDHDVILNCVRNETTQSVLARVLDVSQPGVSYRVSRATRTLRHLAGEPVHVDLIMPELLEAMERTSAVFRRRPELDAFEKWARGCASATSVFAEAGRANSSFILQAVRRARLTGLAGEWVRWRLAMPLRSSLPPRARLMSADEALRRLGETAGCTVEDVARARRVHPSTVRRWLRYAGLPDNHLPTDAHRRRDAVDRQLLERRGYSVVQISREVGITWMTARKSLLRLGLASPGRRWPRVTPEDARQRLAGCEGLSIAQTAARLGVSKATVCVLLRRAGLKSRGAQTGTPRLDPGALRERLAPVEGMSQRRAAKALGVSQRTVRLWRERAGVR